MESGKPEEKRVWKWMGALQLPDCADVGKWLDEHKYHKERQNSIRLRKKELAWKYGRRI